MKIAFFASQVVPFHAFSLEERPLGGTETGVIRLTQALQTLGHEVTVFTPFENPAASTPRYLPHKMIETHPPVDVFIAIRDWIPLLYRIEAKKRMLWTGDSYDQFSNFGLGDKRVAAQVDTLLTVSHWQAKVLSEASGFPFQKTWILGNGIHTPYFDGQEERKRKRLIYSSTPHRGLKYVSSLYLKLKEKHPDAELHIFSSYQVYNQEGIRSWEELEQELKKLPNCTLHGSVSQKELAREFMKSAILFYPCDFEETSCITAMEAQAGGCVVVSSKHAALPETVGNAGLLIEGKPGTLNYEKQFLSAVDKVLSDDSLFDLYSQRGREKAPHFSWIKVAQRFEKFILDYSEQPSLVTL